MSDPQSESEPRPRVAGTWPVVFHLVGLAVVIGAFAAWTIYYEPAVGHERRNFAEVMGIYAGGLLGLAIWSRFKPMPAALVALVVVLVWSVLAGQISEAGLVFALAGLIVAARAIHAALRAYRRA
ncbi:MAG: hypothetical protein BIFFINMI_03586 [Phycisphaerae bacterium]|nr:hypothetical protein [Phycisphaerae bacterium]